MTTRSVTAAVEPLESRLLMARASGIDVSQFQGVMNWTTAKSQGISFAFVRASRSDTVPDTRVTQNVSGAKAVGLQVGVYHRALPFSNTTDSGAFRDPIVDANSFLSAGGAYMGPGYIRPVIDVENGSKLNTTPVNGYNLKTWVIAFANRIKEVKGVTPLIYSGSYRANLDSSVVAALPDLWVANWNQTTYGDPITGTGSPPTTPWPTWKFWQYDSPNGLGTTYGAQSTDIDLDVFNGDVAGLQNVLITAADVTVLRGAVNIADGQPGAVTFGTSEQNSAGSSISFTVRNDGGSVLTLGAPTVPAGFTLTENLVASLLPGQSDTFTVRLETSTLGTKTGNISLSNNDPDENPFNFPITGTIVDTTPPAVSSASFDWNSRPQNLSFQISENVSQSLDATDLVLRNLDTNEVPSSSSFASTFTTFDNSAVFTFPGYTNHFAALPTGNYRATLPAGSLQDISGNSMTAEYTVDFFFLDGDANHDRTVDLTDFTLLASNFNGTGKTYSEADFNYDGTVDLTDFTILAGNFNTSLAPPPSAAPAAAAQAATPLHSLFSAQPLREAGSDLADESFLPA